LMGFLRGAARAAQEATGNAMPSKEPAHLRAGEVPYDNRDPQRTMIRVRWVAGAWALLQVLSYHDHPIPVSFRMLGVLLALVLALGNIAIWVGHRRREAGARSGLLDCAGLALDTSVVSGFVWLWTFDQSSALWAVMYILPLEGALLFRLRGAVTTWAFLTVLYAARELWGSGHYGYPFLWNSVTFRMGVALMIALVAGYMSRDLNLQREKLATANDELRRIDYLRAGLVSTLAHDVRNPLTTIRGVHRTLIRRWGRVDPEIALELLSSADHQARRLEGLAIDLLELARLNDGRLDLNIKAVPVAEAIDTALSYLDPGVSVEMSVDPSLQVKADPDRIQQILVNLMSNAFKYGKPPFAIEAQSHGDCVSLWFKDRGPGIPQDRLDDLFQPFQLQGDSDSVGFGLAIVRALAEAHHGRLTYHPNVPHGACFELELPAANEDTYEALGR
jgi:signal transduction histidine kinase